MFTSTFSAYFTIRASVFSFVCSFKSSPPQILRLLRLEYCSSSSTSSCRLVDACFTLHSYFPSLLFCRLSPSSLFGLAADFICSASDFTNICVRVSAIRESPRADSSLTLKSSSWRRRVVGGVRPVGEDSTSACSRLLSMGGLGIVLKGLIEYVYTRCGAHLQCVRSNIQLFPDKRLKYL